MTERGVRGNWDFDYLQAESDDDDGWYGYDRASSHEPGTEPIPVAEIHERMDGESEQHAGDDSEVPATNGQALPLEEQPADADEPARTYGYPPLVRHRPIGTDFADSLRTLTFKAPTTPWYRTKKALVVAGVTAAVAAVGLLIIRMPGAGPEESTTVVPNATTTAVPTPTSAQPTLTHVESTPPAPPSPPPPPPPPPPPEPASPPVYTGGSQWEPSAPSSQKPPQIDVTRAPISVAPPSRPAPGHNSATPGDAPKRGGGWGW